MQFFSIDFTNITCLDFNFEKGELQCNNCIISSNNCYNEGEIDQNVPLIDENNIDTPIIDENIPIDLNKEEELDINDFDNNDLEVNNNEEYFPVLESLIVLIILGIIGAGIFYYKKKMD